MRITKIFDMLRHTMMRRVQAVHETTGYNIVIDGSYFYRWEKRWKEANKRTRALRRKGIRATFHRVVPKEQAA